MQETAAAGSSLWDRPQRIVAQVEFIKELTGSRSLTVLRPWLHRHPGHSLLLMVLRAYDHLHLLPRCSHQKNHFNCNPISPQSCRSRLVISHSSFIYSQRRCLSSGHHHICVLDCKVIPSGLSFNVPFSRYCRDRFFENRHQITVPPSLEPAVTLSSVLTVKLLFMINSLLYDQTLVLLPISSLLTLYLPINSHVILDQLQGTDSAEADHKAEMGVLSFLPLDTAVSS